MQAKCVKCGTVYEAGTITDIVTLCVNCKRPASDTDILNEMFGGFSDEERN